jgi:hypothetical protein
MTNFTPNGNSIANQPDNQASLKWYNLLFDSFAQPVESIRQSFRTRDISLYKISILIFAIFALLTLILMIEPNKLLSPISYELFRSGFLFYLILMFYLPIILIPKLDYIFLYLINLVIYKNIYNTGNEKPHILELYETNPRNIFSSFLNAMAPVLLIHSIALFNLQLLIYFLYILLNNSALSQTMVLITWMIFKFNLFLFPFITIVIWSGWLFFLLKALEGTKKHILLNITILSIINILLTFPLWRFLYSGLYTTTWRIIESGNSENCLIYTFYASYIFIKSIPH